jgi:hypothetical protein
MTELDGLVGIYGAIDRVAQTDPELRAEISRLLPLYRDPDLRWFDEFEMWLNGLPAEVRREPFPPIEAALIELAEVAPRCRMRPRRLFAIAAAARAFPEMRDLASELGSLAVSALRVTSLAESEEQARQLQEILASEDFMPKADGTGPQDLGVWWDQLVRTAHAAGVIPDMKFMRPRPCAGRLVKVPGVKGPVAALKTDFITHEIDFDRATKFIEPVNWKKCMPWFWCDMKDVGRGLLPGMERYHEVVSTNCALPGTTFRADTDLLFNFMWIPDREHAEVALTNYELGAGRPQAGDVIRLDEGSLVVAKVGPGQRPLRITTTKRIQFSYPFSSRALAMIMCALGYADVAGDLLCCAASISEQPGRNGGTDFPGEPPPTPERGARRDHATAFERCAMATRRGSRTPTGDRPEG